MSNIVFHPSSYRDPSGFIVEKDGVLYRQINTSYKEHFNHFIQSGCYEQLVKKGLIIPHENVTYNIIESPDSYKTIRPTRIEFISYPCEWSFDLLRDAALLTLQLVKEAISFDMILKDATPYNIQWHGGKLVFIDTLSFEKYEEKPWIAYRQFVENFLGPLLIMHYSKQQLPGLLLAWPDGVPLPVIKSLLPKRSRFSLHTYLHIHLHARISAKQKNNSSHPTQLPRKKLLNLVTSLEMLVKSLKNPDYSSTWSGYYGEAVQRKDYLAQKKKIVENWVTGIKDISTAADIGANEGEFAQLLSQMNITTIAADFDPYCINHLYNKIKKSEEKNIQPLVIDLANPTPGFGVNNKERKSFLDRTHVDLALALALIHHLAIGKNIPLELIAETFSGIGKNLIIEFVPKDDEKVKLMLSNKKDIYTNYSEVSFVRAFENYFTIIEEKNVGDSERKLYLMSRNDE